MDAHDRGRPLVAGFSAIIGFAPLRALPADRPLIYVTRRGTAVRTDGVRRDRPGTATTACGQGGSALRRAGVVTTDITTSEGRLLRSQRQLAHSYSTTLDWSGAVPLDAPIYQPHPLRRAEPSDPVAPRRQPKSVASFSRCTREPAQPGTPGSVEAPSRGVPSGHAASSVTNIDYDARRAHADRLRQRRTDTTPRSVDLSPHNLLTRRARRGPRSLHYVWPVNNLTDSRRRAADGFSTRSGPECHAYDALYRLIRGDRREHLDKVGGCACPRLATTCRASHFVRDQRRQGVGRYLGAMHMTSPATSRAWSISEPIRQSRLDARSECTDPADSKPEAEQPADEHAINPLQPGSTAPTATARGNMPRMPHLQEMRWDFRTSCADPAPEGERLRRRRRLQQG